MRFNIDLAKNRAGCAIKISVIIFYKLKFDGMIIVVMVETGKHRSARPQDLRGDLIRSRPDCVEQYKREKENFRRMQSKLGKDPAYQDKYVAVHDNKVVGANSNRLDLFFEVSTRFSCGSVYIAKVYPPKKMD